MDVIDEYSTDQDREEALKQRLNPEVLEALVLAGRTWGWSGDYTEVADFIRWCYSLTDQPVPDLTPY